MPPPRTIFSHLPFAHPYLNLAEEEGSLLDIEVRKLRFLKEIEFNIKKEMSLLSDCEFPEEIETSLINEIVFNLLYYFLLVFGLLQDITGSFIFASFLFALIPGVTPLVITFLSVIFTMFDSILFYAFEVSLLKEALGFSSGQSDAPSFIALKMQQLTVTISINQLLSNIDVLTMDNCSYENYTKLAVLFNQDMAYQQEHIGHYEEPIWATLLKWGVVGFGILSSTANSYFWATSLLEGVYPALLGTFLGWLFIVLTITAGLGFYYAMGATGMIELVNPSRVEFDTFKEALLQFTPKIESDFEVVRSMKLSQVKSAVEDSSTQTDAYGPRFYRNGLSLFSEPITELRRTSSCPNLLCLVN